MAFFFGDPSEIAQAYRDSALALGPGIADCHYSEMDIEELKKAFTYAYMAARDAMYDGATAEALEILIDEFDTLFQALAEASEDFVAKVDRGMHEYLGGYTSANQQKYRKLAGLA